MTDSADTQDQSSNQERTYIEADGGPTEHVTAANVQDMQNHVQPLGAISCNNKRVCSTPNFAKFPTHTAL
jgi:hypothetical protein